ncbi:SRPBCC family protein [Microbacterium sp. p3-SID336]|uniref:SRPBCC family protein n=1 Tax=Microbacterium sp. p3-SID336 TaxID=2916212 RepID=UPI0021A7E5CF|nr:SRPBCC family protein [Microbacterium sp. p3-SID336]MCT1476936.1 SRPBCC family protein [Microbacterium sp. p3-SID336]
MPRFVLETVIAASPRVVFEAALDPQLHVRSMARYGETMIEPPAGGVFSEGSTVTWRARHFGIPFRLRSVVFDIEPPHRFSDRQVAGPFRAFRHDHEFLPRDGGTLMRDTIEFRSPLGPLGRLVDALVLGRYLRRLIAERNDAVAAAIEGRGRTLPA